MNVFPESMDKLDPQELERSITQVDRYIRYMCERIDFAYKNLGRDAAAAGNNALENYQRLLALADGVAALTSQANSLAGLIGSAQDAIEALQKTEMPLIIGTQTATTASWTGEAPFSELKHGQSILYYLPRTSDSNATLDLILSDGETHTGAVNLYYSGTTRIGTHYSAGNVVRLTYLEDIAINGSGSYTGWWAEANYDSNTYYDLRHYNKIKAAEAIAGSMIIVGTSSGYRKAAAGVGFDITYPILWAAGELSSGGTGTNNYNAKYSCTLRNNVSGWTGTAYQMVYLVGSLSGVTFTIGTDVFTQTVLTAENGLVYIPIGLAYSTYQIRFVPQNELYSYHDGAFQRL